MSDAIDKLGRYESQEFLLIVAGGRDFRCERTMREALAVLTGGPLAGKQLIIVSGAARGADEVGLRWARDNKVPTLTYPAQWHSDGPNAGHKRNEEMARVAHGLLAFWDGHSPGTKHMIDTAQREGLMCYVIRYGAAEPHHTA